MTKTEYQRYLKSHKWRHFKNRIYQKYKCCQKCGKKYNLDLHHISYARVGHERDEDVILLCRKHHYQMPHPHRRKPFRQIRPSDIIHWIAIWLRDNFSIEEKKRRKVYYWSIKQ